MIHFTGYVSCLLWIAVHISYQAFELWRYFCVIQNQAIIHRRLLILSFSWNTKKKTKKKPSYDPWWLMTNKKHLKKKPFLASHLYIYISMYIQCLCD